METGERQRGEGELPPSGEVTPIFSQSCVALQGVWQVRNPSTTVGMKVTDPFPRSSQNLNVNYAHRIHSLK